MKHKIIITFCLCFTVIFNFLMFFVHTNDIYSKKEYKGIEDFYSSELLEDKELVSSIYHNYGLFKYLYFKDRPQEEMLANYFEFLDNCFKEEITIHMGLSGTAKIEDFELSVGAMSDGLSPSSGTLEGVISGNVDVIDKMFYNIDDKNTINSKMLSFYQEQWYDFYYQGIEIEEYVMYHPFCSYMDFGDKSVSTSSGEIIYLFSKPVDGKQYVFLYRNCVSVTTGVSRW